MALERALEVFWTKGYEATSIADLVPGPRARRLKWFRDYAPAGPVDTGTRKNLRLDAATALSTK